MVKQKKQQNGAKLEVKKIPQDKVERIDEWNNTFFSNVAGFDFDGRNITIDFMRRSTRTKPDKYVEVVEHNSVILDIFHAKDFAVKFKGLVDSLEKQFGNVESPEFFKKIQTETQSKIKKV